MATVSSYKVEDTLEIHGVRFGVAYQNYSGKVAVNLFAPKNGSIWPELPLREDQVRTFVDGVLAWALEPKSRAELKGIIGDQVWAWLQQFDQLTMNVTTKILA